MFNPEFYPTPDAVIEKMLAPLFVTHKGYRHSSFFGPGRYEQEEDITTFPYATVLDPEAGSGAILDYIGRILDQQGYGGYCKEKKLYCFEIDPTLQATLQGKNYRLLGHDFLKYSGDMPIPLIVMNPPFSCGDQHTLHAYHIVDNGGQVVSLVNSETLRNPCTRTRQQLLNLIEQVGGTVEELGACFKDSERPTDVEVSIIRLKKPEGADRFTFNWQNKSQERDFDTSRHNTHEVAGRDVIGNMLTQYDCLREQFMNLLRAIDGIKHYGAGLTNSRGVRDAWRVARDIIENPSSGKKNESYRQQYLSFTEEMRQQIWGVVLEKVNIQKFMTNAVRENFTKYSVQTGWLDFTRENVFQLLSMVLDNTGNILEVAIGDLFDTFTRYHVENRCHVEGWKTNSRYKVNRKLILPNWVSFGEYSSGFEVDYRNRDRYSDIDKVMCYLTGEKYETTLLISDALEAKFKELGRVGSGTFDNVCESHFFKIRFFKKGTIHLEFLDSRLHEEFNLRACAGKQWLPAEEQQAYQTRKTSPFPKATPAPGTDLAALVGNGVREEVFQRLLGSMDGGSDLAQVVSTPAAMEPAREWAHAEEVQGQPVEVETEEVETVPVVMVVATAEVLAEESEETTAAPVVAPVVMGRPQVSGARSRSSASSRRSAPQRPGAGSGQMGLFEDLFSPVEAQTQPPALREAA